MRFLANENFPIASIHLLRHAGHDLVAIIEDSPGAKDPIVLARATAESRIILTFDRDYGELIFRFGLPPPAGIIYLRYDPADPNEPAHHVLRLLAIEGLILFGKFTVAERDRVRQRALPTKP